MVADSIPWPGLMWEISAELVLSSPWHQWWWVSRGLVLRTLCLLLFKSLKKMWRVTSEIPLYGDHRAIRPQWHSFIKKKKKKVVSLKVACCITLADAEEVKEGVLKDLHWLLIGGNCSSGVSCPFTAFPSLTKANAVGSAEVHRYRHVSSFCDRNTQSNSSSFTLIFKTATNVRQQLFILWNYISVPSLS